MVTDWKFPRDGSLYSVDMKEIFPYSVRNDMNNVHTDETVERLCLEIEEQTKLMGLMAQYKKKNPNQYEKLNKSKNIYNIQYTNNQDDGSGGNFSFNPESGNFDVNIQTDRRRDYSDIEVLTHEMTHANQYEDGELGFWVKYDRNDPTKAILVVPIAHDITDEIEAAKQADKMILVPEGELRIELRTRTKYSELSPDRTNVSQYLLDTWGIDINQPDTYNNALQRVIHNVTVK